MPDLLQVKLDILKIEIETINSAILNKDETTRQIKNWAITLWLGATGFAATQHIDAPSAATAVWALATVAIPASFMMLELHHRRIQRKFIWRAGKIHSFINGLDEAWSLSKAIASNGETDFRFYDPGGENWRRELGGDEAKKFEAFISQLNLLKTNKRIYMLYGVLALFSALLAGFGFLPSLVEKLLVLLGGVTGQFA